MENLQKLILDIQSLGLFDIEKFSKRLVCVLFENLKLKAVSFYVVSARKDSLILQAQQGFQYSDFQSFELPLNTFAGTSFTKNKILVEKDISKRSDYRDVSLIPKYELKSALAIPIPNLGHEFHQVSGVICIYPSSEIFSEPNSLEFLVTSISYAYLHSVQRTKILIREEAVNSIRASTDLNSALHRIIKVISNFMRFEAGSIFLYEEKVRRLQLHATSGIESELYKHDIVYSKSNNTESDSLTWKAFSEGKLISVSHLDKNMLKNEKYYETTSVRSPSSLFLPIFGKEKSLNKVKHKGVFRCRIKTILHDGKSESVSFSLDDSEMLTYICEIIGLTFHIFTHRENQISYFERVMHGTKSNIQTSIQNLEILERRGNLEKNIEKDLHFAVLDTREWLEDIKNQMERIEAAHRSVVNLEDIYVGNILINIVRYFQKSAQSRGIENALITNLKKSQFFTLPKVRADEKLLMLVFRNIVENALKYRSLDSTFCKVDIKYEIEKEFINILFTDYGIGIPIEEKFDVFSEGFRSEIASSQDPSGTGLGLSQSFESMQAIGGDLVLLKCFPVTLKVKIKRV